MKECFMSGLPGFYEYIDDSGDKYPVCKEFYDSAIKLQEKYPNSTINDCMGALVINLWKESVAKKGLVEQKKSKWGMNFFKRK